MVSGGEGPVGRAEAAGDGVEGISWAHGVVEARGRRWPGRPGGNKQHLTDANVGRVDDAVGLSDGPHRGAEAAGDGIEGIAPAHGVIETRLRRGLGSPGRGGVGGDTDGQHQQHRQQGQNRGFAQFALHLPLLLSSPRISRGRPLENALSNAFSVHRFGHFLP